jgi:hypothetical protein
MAEEMTLSYDVFCVVSHFDLNLLFLADPRDTPTV